MHKQSFGVTWFSALAGALFLVTPRIGPAQGVAPYLHIGAGAAFVQDFIINVEDLPGKLKTDVGERFSAAFGLTLYSGPKFESAIQFETGVVHNSLRSIDFGDFGGGSSVDGDFYQVPFLVDLVYTFHVGPRLLPYFAVGGGGVYNRLKIESLGDFPLDSTTTETDAAVQGTAGLKFKLSDNSELGAEYKFLATFPSTDDYIGTHSLSLVFVMRF